MNDSQRKASCAHSIDQISSSRLIYLLPRGGGGGKKKRGGGKVEWSGGGDGGVVVKFQQPWNGRKEVKEGRKKGVGGCSCRFPEANLGKVGKLQWID